MYTARLLNGNVHTIDADEHSIEAAIGSVGAGPSETVVRFWKDKPVSNAEKLTLGGVDRKRRDLVAVIPLSHIELITRTA